MSYPNQEQAAILRHLHGTHVELTAAGTRKTQTIADRLAATIAAFIASGMPPEKTLVVTNLILRDYAKMAPQLSDT